MADSSEYRFNCSEYVLHKGNLPIGPLLAEVALAFDSENDVLHKHGSPEKVQAWARAQAKKLRDSDLGDMADALLVVTGRFPLEELNKCLTHAGYIGVFYRRLLAGQVQEAPLLPAPINA